jgi:hypothetical protein
MGGWPRVGRHHAIHEVTARIWVAPVDAEAAPGFLREVRCAQRVNHPNLARVVGFGHEPDLGVGWVAEEPAPGRIPDGAVPLGRALGWAEGLADGLATAHALGAFHDDLVASAVRTDGEVARITGLGAAALWRASDGAQSTSEAANDVFALGRLVATWVSAETRLPPDVQALLDEVCGPEATHRLDVALAVRDRLRALGPASRWSPRRENEPGNVPSADATGDTWSGLVVEDTPTWTGELTPPNTVAPDPPTVPPPVPGPRKVPPMQVTRFGLLIIGLLAGLLVVGVVFGLGATWMAATVASVPIPRFEPEATRKAVPASGPEEDSDPASTEGPPAPGEAASAPGDLSREPAFRQAVDRLSEAARQCARRHKGPYDQVLEVRLQLQGGAVTDVSVGGFGLPGAGRACVVNAARTLTFPTTMTGTGRADILWGRAQR